MSAIKASVGDDLIPLDNRSIDRAAKTQVTLDAAAKTNFTKIERQDPNAINGFRDLKISLVTPENTLEKKAKEIATPSIIPSFARDAPNTSTIKIGNNENTIKDEVLQKKLIHETAHKLWRDSDSFNS